MTSRFVALLALTMPSLVGTAFLTANGETTRMLRSPSVSATHVAFAYANNVWVVERSGGIARRLTSFQGQTTNPRFSPDGRSIAFSAEYAGNRYYFAQQDKKGAAIDERYNGGGSAADYIIDVSDATSMAISTTWPATVFRSPALQPASGGQR